MGSVASPSRREWGRLVGLYVAIALLYAAYALGKHARLETSGFDLGIFDQAIWRWSRFLSPENTVRRVPNLFADHFHPALLLLVPVRWLGFDARGLLFVQPFIACAAAFPIFAFARRRMEALSALFVALAYLVSWGLAEGMAFDIHEFAFTALALSLAVDAFDRRLGWPFWAVIVFWLLTKEDQGLAVAGLGLVALVGRRWGLGAGLLGLGLGWVLLTTRLIIPLFSGGAYAHWLYGHLGATPGEVVLFAMTHPVVFVKAIFLPGVKTQTLLKLFAGYAFAPLLSPYLLVFVPPTLAYLLSNNSGLWESTNHYWMPVSAAAALATADGLGRLVLRRKEKSGGRLPLLAAGAIFAASLFVALAVVQVPQPIALRRGWWAETEYARDGVAILGQIPPDVSVSATNYALPHLSGRKWIYLCRYGYAAGEAYPPLRTRYVVIDAKSRDLAGRREPGHPFRDPDYTLIDRRGGWAIYRLDDDLPDVTGHRPSPPGTDPRGGGMLFDERAVQ